MIITYSVEAAQQSMAQVLREKEFRKLAGKSPAVTSKNFKTPAKRISNKSFVVSSVQFGPEPVAKKTSRNIASVRVSAPKAIRKTEPTPVKKATKNPIGLNGFKDLEV